RYSPGEYRDRLFDFAERAGCDERGLARDVVRDDGAVISPTRRLWPQTEALKACIAMTRAGREGAEARIGVITNRIFTDYLAPAISGGWRDQLGEGGAPSGAHIPASTFYHVIGAFALAIETLGEA
ncbi:MAG: AGE family epimerase/isomerase, partial [Pseudomonadota bacterium]